MMFTPRCKNLHFPTNSEELTDDNGFKDFFALIENFLASQPDVPLEEDYKPCSLRLRKDLHLLNR